MNVSKVISFSLSLINPQIEKAKSINSIIISFFISDLIFYANLSRFL